MAITVQDLLIRVRAQTAEAETALGGLRGGLATLGILAAGAAAAGFVKLGMEAQTQLNIVQALTGASAQQMQFYTASLEGMGAKMGFELGEAAKGLYYVVSAGFQGKDAMELVRLSMEHAAAAGAPLESVTNGLTSAMNAYHASIADATKYSDIFTLAVTYGKQTTEDFANNVSKAALMAAAAHVPFIQLAAAEAALTEKGEPANRAFTELSFMMSKIAVPSAKAMADSVASLGGHLDQTKYQSADLMGKLLLLKNASGLTTDEFLKVVGGTRSARGALGLLADGGAAYTDILKKMKTQQDVTDKAFETHTHTMQYGFDVIKAAVSNAALAFVDFITPKVVPYLTAIASKLTDVTTHVQQYAPLIGGVAVAATVLLAAAMWSLAAAVIAATWPFVLAAVVIGALVAGVIWAYQNFKPFRDAIALVGATAQQVWSFLQASFAPALKQIGDVVKSQILPAWNSLLPVLQQAAPLFQFLGAIIGGVLLVALGLLVGVINAVIQGFAGLLTGLAVAFGGLVQLVVGIVQVILSTWSYFFNILSDIFTGNWNKIGTDTMAYLHGMASGIMNILSGLFNVVIGLFSGLVLGVVGIISGFVGGIIGFFQHMYDVIVGHSIVPDMVNGILSWFRRIVEAIGIVNGIIGAVIGIFQRAAGQANAAMMGLVSAVLGALGGLGGRLASVVVSAINNMIGAIRGMAGAVAGAFGSLFGGLHLPHFADGGTMPHDGLAVINERGPGEIVALPGGARVYPNGAVPRQSGGGSGVGAMVIHVVSHTYLDGRETTESVLRHAPAVARLATGQRI